MISLRAVSSFFVTRAMAFSEQIRGRLSDVARAALRCIPTQIFAGASWNGVGAIHPAPSISLVRPTASPPLPPLVRPTGPPPAPPRGGPPAYPAPAPPRGGPPAYPAPAQPLVRPTGPPPPLHIPATAHVSRQATRCDRQSARHTRS